MLLKHLSSTREFKSHISQDNSIIMIHKTNCPYCERAIPWMKEHTRDYPKANIALANKDDIKEVLNVFQVYSYPTFVAFKSGKITDIFFGDTVYEKVIDFFRRNIE